MSAEPSENQAKMPRVARALLLYCEEHTNLALSDELALDGYEVHRASDPAMLRAACDTREIALVIFGRAADRGAGLDVLRRLRAGEFTPEASPRLRALWMSPNGDLGDVLRGTLASSPRQLQRAYEQFGRGTFRDDLLARRMIAAAELMSKPSIPMRDVARMVGYSQPPHFARALRRCYAFRPPSFGPR